MRDLAETSFVGRVAELARLGELVASHERLVTLIGPPGVGKSRLVARYGQTIDATLIDVTDVTDEAGFDQAVADGIGWRVGSPAQDERGLVVLDNAEHILELVASRVLDWLRRAPGLRVIVTSRERMRIEGERILEIGPLQLPDAGERDLAVVVATEAAQLLLARTPDLGLQPQDAPLIADLLHRLDGLPLAIELAAARASLLDLRQLTQRLDRRFDLLARDTRDRSIRHSSLWDAIGGSWALLPPAEQAGLAQCSVFRGSFPLVAAESIIELGDGAPPVLDVLHKLVDRSLVRVIRLHSRELRFRLYDSIRDFAAEQLAKTEARTDVLARHARYFHLPHWFERLAGQVPASPSPGLRSRIALDIEDLAAAFEYNLGDPERLTEIIARKFPTLDQVTKLISYHARIGPIWLLRRAAQEAVSLASVRAKDPVTRSAMFRLLASVAATVGMIPAAQRMLDRAFAEAEQTKQPAIRGRTLLVFGSGSVAGDSDTRRAVLAEALAIARELGDTELEACTLAQIGATYSDDAQIEEAITHWDPAIERLRRLDWEPEHALVLASRGIAHQEQGRFAAARRDLEAARDVHRGRGDARLESGVEGYLAMLDHEVGELDAAATRYRAAIEALASVGARGMESLCMAFLGALEVERGNLVDANTAFAAAELGVRTYGQVVEAAIVETLRAMLDVAAARDAHANDDAELASMLRARAEEWAARARHPSPDLRCARRLLHRALADTALVVAADGSWFRVRNGREVNLASRAVLRKLLVALADNRAIAVADLIAAGWPDQVIEPIAAGNRLHVALTTLRNLGLRDLLVRDGETYRWRTPVHRARPR